MVKYEGSRYIHSEQKIFPIILLLSIVNKTQILSSPYKDLGAEHKMSLVIPFTVCTHFI